MRFLAFVLISLGFSVGFWQWQLSQEPAPQTQASEPAQAEDTKTQAVREMAKFLENEGRVLVEQPSPSTNPTPTNIGQTERNVSDGERAFEEDTARYFGGGQVGQALHKLVVLNRYAMLSSAGDTGMYDAQMKVLNEDPDTAVQDIDEAIRNLPAEMESDRSYLRQLREQLVNNARNTGQ